MKDRPALDVSGLPAYAFGHRSMLWWATMGIIVIEGSMFAILVAAYFYLKSRALEWPPNTLPPDLTCGTINTLVLIASVVPNYIYKKAAEREDLRKVRIWMVVSIVFAIAFNVIRVFEFGWLRCNWDTNAYGSIVWTIMGFHTTHLVTDFLDTIDNEWVHTLQHLSFLVSALFFWWALMRSRSRVTGYGAAVLYLFTTSIHSGVLGALITFASTLWYPAYATTTAAWGLTALEDQQLGGLIMWVPAGLVYIVAGLALFAGWMRESERRAIRNSR